MNFRHIICLGAVFGAALNAVAAGGGQWTAGMDDDAGKAAVGEIGETADGRDGSGRGVRHSPAREEARDMKRDVGRDGSDKSGDGKVSSIAKRVIFFIQENYDKRITLDQISKEVLTDKYTLCKIFKKLTGQTIFENLNEYRCLKAAEYIAEGKSVSEAANLCGFDNNSFFTKTFKRYIGTLPSKITTLE